MLKVLDRRSDIARAQKKLLAILDDAASQVATVNVGHQGGGVEAQVRYIDDLDLWLGYADMGNRFWNAVGFGNPFTSGWLRLLINPQDVISFRRVVNTPKRGIGDRAATGQGHRRQGGDRSCRGGGDRAPLRFRQAACRTLLDHAQQLSAPGFRRATRPSIRRSRAGQ